MILLALPFLIGLMLLSAVWFAYARIQLPEAFPPIQTTYLYDRNGELITTLHGAVDRTIVPLAEMSPHIKDAVIATEDHEFYQHPGVDLRGVIRAAWTNLRGTDNEVQGASTITQQLVKSVYAGEYVPDPETGVLEYVQPERTIANKVREMLLAMKLEQELGKDQILERYLNTVYFGQGAYGIEAAAQTYFGDEVHASDLTILQAATLAGVLHAPELYDPIDRPDDNRFRRDYTLDQMVLYGYISEERAAKLKAEECCGTTERSDDRIDAPGDAEYFVDHTRRTLFDLYGGETVYGGGLHVTTTLDLKLQREAERIVEEHLPSEPGNPSAALVSIDVETGGILAMVGGSNWDRSKVNLATFPCEGCGRQAGSAFKAITLAAAMQEGYDLRSYWYGPYTTSIPGCPDPEQPDGLWHPTNAEGSGNYSLEAATAHSVNTIFAMLVSELGPDKVVDMAAKLGIRSDLEPYCSITLGSVAVNPLEMTNAYATLAAHGKRHWATPIVEVANANGKVDRTIRNRGEQVIDANDADLVTSALEGVVQGGTGSAAAVPGYPVAGKTGSAQDNVDAWFCGYTTQIATCIWIGYPKGEVPLLDIEGVDVVFGGTIPAAIFSDFMSVAMDGLEPVPFATPSYEGHPIGPETPAPSPVPTPSVTVSESPSPTEEPEPTAEPTPTDGPSPTPEE